jgi:glycosyltransferase involved in cell wall biosynthesis
LRSRKHIFFIYGKSSSFIQEDITYFKSNYILTEYQFDPTKHIFLFVFKQLKLFLHLIINFRKYDVYISWFADYYSLLPLLIGKIGRRKKIIITGGFDAVSIPQLKYGVFSKKDVRYFFVYSAYKLADFILPVDKSLEKGINYYGSLNENGLPTGVKSFIPNLKGKFKIIPTGYDKNKWIKGNIQKEDNTVICIASIPDKRTYYLKGFDLLIEIAKKMPHVKFTIVGFNSEMEEFVNSIKSSNVIISGFIPNDELPAIMATQKVFALFSLSEGLPNTLCEAMLCECIPVGSNVNGIPTAIGQTGYIIDRKEIPEAIQAIENALKDDENKGKNARSRIINLFSQNQRREKLNAVIN